MIMVGTELNESSSGEKKSKKALNNLNKRKTVELKRSINLIEYQNFPLIFADPSTQKKKNCSILPSKGNVNFLRSDNINNIKHSNNPFNSFNSEFVRSENSFDRSFYDKLYKNLKKENMKIRKKKKSKFDKSEWPSAAQLESPILIKKNKEVSNYTSQLIECSQNISQNSFKHIGEEIGSSSKILYKIKNEVPKSGFYKANASEKVKEEANSNNLNNVNSLISIPSNVASSIEKLKLLKSQHAEKVKMENSIKLQNSSNIINKSLDKPNESLINNIEDKKEKNKSNHINLESNNSKILPTTTINANMTHNRKGKKSFCCLPFLC